MAFNQESGLLKKEQMFLRMGNRKAKCKVCLQILEITEKTLETEFWKHQIDGEHLKASINFIVQHLSIGKQNKNEQKIFRLFDLSKAKQLQAQGMDELDEYIQEQAQKVIEIFVSKGGISNGEAFELLACKLKEMLDQGVDSVSPLFFQELQEELESFDLNNVMQMTDGLGIAKEKKSQKPPKFQKKYQKKIWNQEPFLLSYNDYFKSFVEDLINANQLLEGSCFLLARLGITAQQMLNIKISKIPQLIIKAQNTQAKPDKWIDDIFLQLIKMFQTDERFKNKDALVQDCNNVKELRRRLQIIRNQIQKNTQDPKFQAFLTTLRVKALNALWRTGQKRPIINQQAQTPQPIQAPHQPEQNTPQENAKIVQKDQNDKEKAPPQDQKKNLQQQSPAEGLVEKVISQQNQGQNQLAQSENQEDFNQQVKRTAESLIISSEEKIKDLVKQNKYDRFWVPRQTISNSKMKLQENQQESNQIQACEDQQQNQSLLQFAENQ